MGFASVPKAFPDQYLRLLSFRYRAWCRTQPKKIKLKMKVAMDLRQSPQYCICNQLQGLPNGDLSIDISLAFQELPQKCPAERFEQLTKQFTTVLKFVFHQCLRGSVHA